jgi:hypothetical protein
LTAIVHEADTRIAYSLREAAAMLGKSPRTLKRLHLADPDALPLRRLGRDLMVPAGWLAQYAAWPAEGSAA